MQRFSDPSENTPEFSSTSEKKALRLSKSSERRSLGLRGHKQALCQRAKHAYIWAGAPERERERAFKGATTTVPTSQQLNMGKDPGYFHSAP